MAEGIEKRHTCGKEQERLDKNEHKVDCPEPHCCLLDAREEFFAGDHLAGIGFSLVKLHASDTEEGKDDNGNHNKPHPPDEVGCASPEQQPMGQGFNVIENGSAGRGVARHHFKESIGE